jgi:ATP-binding protein involved in chromosome partitioning
VGKEEEKVTALLRQIPFTKEKNIVDFGVVTQVDVEGKQAFVELEFFSQEKEIHNRVRSEVETLLKKEGYEPRVEVKVRSLRPHATPRDPWEGRKPVPGVKTILAVASGKGGVGKSTLAVNLSITLQNLGYKTGLLDADIYGPNTPILLGIGKVELKGDPETKKIQPILAHGLKTISIGYLIQPDQAVIWRGPMLSKALDDFLHQVHWGELDFLILDLPPGTGDVPLSLAQKAPLNGAILVTTPQDVALSDVIRGYAMFQKLDIPVLGIIENMSFFLCPHCGKETAIFSRGGGRKEAEKRGIPFLGEIPLDPNLRSASDEGVPLPIRDPKHPISRSFEEIARKILDNFPSSKTG